MESNKTFFSELEQEIDTFKKENTKIIGLKKKLTEEKQRLTKVIII